MGLIHSIKHSRLFMNMLRFLIAGSFFAPVCWAANVYVRAGGGGNGSDWANAAPRLPATLVRGNTYYVACGTYPSYRFETPVSGTILITVKRATVADHGTDVGWQDSFGSGCQAVFSGQMVFASSNWVFDGQERTSPTSGHGFKINKKLAPNNNASLFISDPFTGCCGLVASNVTIRFVEIEGTGSKDDTFNDRGIQSNVSGTQNIVIQYSYVHDLGESAILLREVKNMIIEHSWIARNNSSPAAHSEGISATSGIDNFTIRFNHFEDNEGTAFIATPGSAGSTAPVNSNWYIYGNVFFHTNNATNPPSLLHGGVGGGVILFFQSRFTGEVLIFNNTISNVSPAAVGGGLNASRIGIEPDGTTLQKLHVRNNIWHNSSLPEAILPGGAVADLAYTHQAYFSTPNNDADTNKQVGSGSPFVDVAAKNFRLLAPTNNGFTTPTPYNIDPLGKARAGDGVWDRGAFEFGRPAPPTNLRKAP